MARVESKTVISTPERLESVPPTADGVAGRLGHWMAPNQLDAKVQELFPGCMRGRFGFLKDSVVEYPLKAIIWRRIQPQAVGKTGGGVHSHNVKACRTKISY